MSNRQPRAMDTRLTCRKWTLFTMCLIGMVSTIVILILSVKELNLPNDHYIWRIAALNEHTVKIIMISAFTVAIVIQLVGIWGAYKTNYCMCIIYGVIMIIAFIVSVLPALYTGYNAIWFLTGWFFLTSCFATSFASAIRRCQTTRPARMGTVSARNATIVLAQPPPTIVYQLPPQSPYVNAGPPTPNVMYNSPPQAHSSYQGYQQQPPPSYSQLAYDSGCYPTPNPMSSQTYGESKPEPSAPAWP